MKILISTNKLLISIFQCCSLLKIKKMHQIFKNEESRLPSRALSLRPDCSAIHSAETSDQPADWLLHPTGITFKFNANLLEDPIEKVNFESDSYSDRKKTFIINNIKPTMF